MINNAVPAGMELSDSEDEYLGEYPANKSNGHSSKTSKSPKQIFAEKLSTCVRENNLTALQSALTSTEAKGFNIDEPLDGRWSGWNLLYEACHHARVEIVRYLVEKRGADPGASETGETALMVACYSEARSEDVLEVVKILVTVPLIIAASNNSGVTALMFASKAGHIEVVRYLLLHGPANAINAVDNEGMNALFHAIGGKRTEVAELLLRSGIDLTVCNMFGLTAKHYAIEEDQQDIIELFPREAEKYQTPAAFMSYNRFEDLIPGMSDVPAYFPEVIAILRGIECEQFIEKFAEAKVGLEEFLTISDGRMEEIGIEYAFHRRLIKAGIHKFLLQKWSRQAFFVPDFDKDLLTMDLIMILANVLRQLVLMKAHLKQLDVNRTYTNVKPSLLKDLKENLQKLKKRFKQRIPKALPNPLLIRKKTSKRCAIKYAGLIAVPIVIISAFKLFTMLK